MEYTTVSAMDFSKIILNPSIVLLDVRTPEEYAEGHIANAMNIDFTAPEFMEKVKASIAVDKEVAVYCRSGKRSASAAEQMSDSGYKVINMAGGIIDWTVTGLPVQK